MILTQKKPTVYAINVTMLTVKSSPFVTHFVTYSPCIMLYRGSTVHLWWKWCPR